MSHIFYGTNNFCDTIIIANYDTVSWALWKVTKKLSCRGMMQRLTYES